MDFNSGARIVGGVLAGIILFVVLKKWGTIIQFLREVKVELLKATWPWDPKEKTFAAKYKELIDSTVVVIIAMILLSAYIALLDFSLMGINRFFTK
jgi:preprotein translocase subunit SecE